jgi:hypothetical protein
MKCVGLSGKRIMFFSHESYIFRRHRHFKVKQIAAVQNWQSRVPGTLKAVNFDVHYMVPSLEYYVGTVHFTK